LDYPRFVGLYVLYKFDESLLPVVNFTETRTYGDKIVAGETILNGRYKLVEQIGSGGMSVVYKAIDLSLGHTVAVKILRPSLTQAPSFVEKFHIQASENVFLDHPNIVTTLNIGSDDKIHYVVMEFVEGTDLKKLIKSKGAMSIKRTLDIGIQMCEGVGHAHKKGMTHGNIKPQNILVTADDNVKVTDFGIVQTVIDTLPDITKRIWGSPQYNSPEKLEGVPLTFAMDVYSIGIILFEMLTSRLPYISANDRDLMLAHMHEPIPSVIKFRPDVPEVLDAVITRALSKSPQERYHNAQQLAEVLHQIPMDDAYDQLPVLNLPKRESTIPSRSRRWGNIRSQHPDANVMSPPRYTSTLSPNFDGKETE